MKVHKVSDIENYRIELGEDELDVELGEDLPATVVDATVVDGKLVEAQVYNAGVGGAPSTLLAVWTHSSAPKVLLKALGLK